jgi:hypothetical protein
MKLSFTPVGIGAALVAGLVLAIIGHPAPPGTPMPNVASAPATTGAPQRFVLKSVSVELPSSDISPGGAAANAISMIAWPATRRHGADPAPCQGSVGREVDKMIHASRRRSTSATPRSSIICRRPRAQVKVGHVLIVDASTTSSSTYATSGRRRLVPARARHDARGLDPAEGPRTSVSSAAEINLRPLSASKAEWFTADPRGRQR